MCGIVGFIGENVISKAINSLKSLEYRGYDSAGLSTISDGQLCVYKKTGRISALEESIADIDFDVSLAISHCRWATHGKPSEINAHPHKVGNIALVHNGIIENYRELKDKHNIETTSTTDTEVLAHLINNSSKPNLLEKVKDAVDEVEGAYAIAVISDLEPDCIVVARKRSPLVIGVVENGAVLASDIYTLLPYTNKVIVLVDGDVGVVKDGSIEIFDSEGRVERGVLDIPWSPQSSTIECGTFMYKEIHEQPTAICNTIIQNDWSEIERYFKYLTTRGQITLTACGTSFHACMIGAMLFESMGVRANAKLASELESSFAIIEENDLVLAISQSGETADTLSAIRYAKKNGAKIVSIVNTIGSSVEFESDYTIHLAAGPEISVASTKAFTTQLATLLMIYAGLAGKTKQYEEWIMKCARNIEFVFEQEAKISEISKVVSSAQTVLYLGRGMSVPVALEGALKLKEISYIHAEGFAGGEMKHGSIALVEEGTPVIGIVCGTEYKKIISNLEESKSRGAKIIAIAIEGNGLGDLADDIIFIPDTQDNLLPIMAAIPLQLLAMYAAESLGADIDKPKNLAKSVTVE